jgi:pantothenate synthetase
MSSRNERLSKEERTEAATQFIKHWLQKQNLKTAQQKNYCLVKSIIEKNPL